MGGVVFYSNSITKILGGAVGYSVITLFLWQGILLLLHPIGKHQHSGRVFKTTMGCVVFYSNSITKLLGGAVRYSVITLFLWQGFLLLLQYYW
jgi:hypothetical protein